MARPAQELAFGKGAQAHDAFGECAVGSMAIGKYIELGPDQPMILVNNQVAGFRHKRKPRLDDSVDLESVLSKSHLIARQGQNGAQAITPREPPARVR